MKKRKKKKKVLFDAPGEVDGPPYDRPMAENMTGIDPEAGARQGGDPPESPGRELPP